VIETHRFWGGGRRGALGETDIIVQYGELTDRVTLNVRECPYIEGKMKFGCPR